MLPEDEKLKINMTFPLAFEPGSRYCAASLIFIVTYFVHRYVTNQHFSLHNQQ